MYLAIHEGGEVEELKTIPDWAGESIEAGVFTLIRKLHYTGCFEQMNPDGSWERL